jgi:4-amino-4-deoxy-L-arabinose transferase-like glycosyltransferase
MWWRAALRQRRLDVAFFVVALAIYLPGIGWGVPHEAIRERAAAWGSDEIAPAALSQINTTLTRAGRYNPQYPLFGYVIQAVTVTPYAMVFGRLWEPPPARAARVLRMYVILSRLASVLMSAALVVIAARTAAVLWGPASAAIAGSLTLLLYPMFYYARTSNVDASALALGGVALWQYAICLTRGLDKRTAILLGLSAALAVATKDFMIGIVAPIGMVVALIYWRQAPRLVLLAAIVALVVYPIASGAVFNLDRYQAHIHFIRYGSTRHYGFQFGSTDSYAHVFAKATGYLVMAMSVPASLLAIAGVVVCLRSRRRLLLWLLPPISIIVITILPTRFVLYRFLFPTAYCLVFFAALALSSLVASRPRLGRLAVTLTCAWMLLRGADLTWQMLRDSRYEAGEWFERNARAGDRIGYYGTEPHKLPFVSGAVSLMRGPAELPVQDGPEFLVVIPWQDYERVHEYNLPDATYAALRRGDAGYRQLLGLKTPALFQLQPGTWVNPEVKVFVRSDRVLTLVDAQPRIHVLE